MKFFRSQSRHPKWYKFDISSPTSFAARHYNVDVFPVPDDQTAEWDEKIEKRDGKEIIGGICEFEPNLDISHCDPIRFHLYFRWRGPSHMSTMSDEESIAWTLSHAVEIVPQDPNAKKDDDGRYSLEAKVFE